MESIRYEVNQGEIHPCYGEYGDRSWLMLFCADITNHLYLAVRGVTSESPEVIELLESVVSVSCSSQPEGLTVTWRFGRLNPISVRIPKKPVLSPKYRLIPFEAIRDGAPMQIHVIEIRTGRVIATREFELAPAPARMLYGAIERHRAELAGEGKPSVNRDGSLDTLPESAWEVIAGS